MEVPECPVYLELHHARSRCFGANILDPPVHGATGAVYDYTIQLNVFHAFNNDDLFHSPTRSDRVLMRSEMSFPVSAGDYARTLRWLAIGCIEHSTRITSIRCSPLHPAGSLAGNLTGLSAVEI
jgi:hypothetical protein